MAYGAQNDPNETNGASVHTEDVEFDQIPLAAKITVNENPLALFR